MRLLKYHEDGEFSLTEFFDNIPSYAILSHTWGLEEVTFKDMIAGNGRSKMGFEKISFCGEQARRDHLQYFWVDTCCIDKANAVELQEAINSMFRWYQNAAKCYVYLSDVSTKKRKASDSFTDCTWLPAFQLSRWFKRGWTLQELLAPGLGSVEFFSQERVRLGDKRSLERQIHEITRIPVSALRGASLSQFDVEDRLSWAVDRQTTREEDKAYSLFGIFDIQIPLLYGEGAEKALKRLREEIDKPSKDKAFKRLCEEGDTSSKELDSLPSAAGAAFNSFNRQQDPTCLPDTRVDLLQEICNWADGEDARCIFWLNGLAGTGKSTIARTIAQKYYDKDRLGASFFFSRGGGDVSHAGKFFTSIAVQLANNIPSLRPYICDAISSRKDIASQSFRDQWSQLILLPLSKLGSGSSPSSYVLVIDALDECDSDEHIRMVLQLLAGARTSTRLRVLLTSRPEIPIRHGFYQIPDAEHEDFVLHNVPPTTINHDISLFLEHNLGSIRREWNLGADWPGEVVLRDLVQYACGLFIWAATTCRFIREGKQFARKRLDTIIKGSSSAITASEKHLNEIYLTVLEHSISSEFSDEEKQEVYWMLKHSLGSIVILLSPLSTSSLSRLLHVPMEDIDQTFEGLHAILDIPENSNHPLRLHHPSFHDFLLNKDRSGDFWVNEQNAHQSLTTSCIQVMSRKLKNNICEMHAPGSRTGQVERSRIERCLPPEVQYACLYWVQHLHKSGSQVHDDEEVDRFLQTHLLHWLEALGWMGKITEGIEAISTLEDHVLVKGSPNLYAFVHDAKRFALYNRSVIEQAPLQLYCSALVFAPGNSVVRKQFSNCIPDWIQLKPKVQAHWSAALQTLEGHTGYVHSVVFSPNSKQIVSGSDDQTIRLWDVATGALLQTLKGHTDSVNSVVFSPDGKQVMSRSRDQTVRLWNVATGALLQTLKGHTGSISSGAFAAESELLPILRVSNCWVVEDDTNILWLPPDYRGTCSDTWNRNLALGNSSGRISFLGLKEGAKLVI